MGLSGHSGNEPQVFYFDGKSLTTLDAIFLPNIGSESFRIFIKSPYELKYASLDSTEISMCLVNRGKMKELKLTGRWYSIQWNTRLKVGASKHIILLTKPSGAVFRKSFMLNVEGNEKIEKPHGDNK